MLTPIFLASIATLLLNDFVLKYFIPGMLTGKLSDFAGLFAFAVFWSALLPNWTMLIHLAVAVAFVAWKSPVADPAIDAWNGLLPVSISRVIDYWDLTALVVLPLSFFFLQSSWKYLPFRRAGACAVAVVSLFAFTATSQTPTQQAQTLSAGGNYEGAIRILDEAIKTNPRYADAIYDRGVAKLKLGDTVGAEADFASAGVIDPKYGLPLPAPCSGEC